MPVGCPEARFPIAVSIMGHPLDSGEAKLGGVVECVQKAIAVVDFIEVNESCPNVAHGVGGDDELTQRLKAVMAVRDEHKKTTGRHVPILVKLGDLGHPEHTVVFMDNLGVDGIVALNTQKDYSFYHEKLSEVDQRVLEYYTTTYGGGLSGAAISAKTQKQIQAASDFIGRHQNIKLR